MKLTSFLFAAGSALAAASHVRGRRQGGREGTLYSVYAPQGAESRAEGGFVRKNRFRSRTAKTKPGRSGTGWRIFRRQGLFKAAGNKGPGKRTGMKAPPPEKAGPKERGMQQETARGKVEKAARQGKHPSGRDDPPARFVRAGRNMHKAGGGRERKFGGISNGVQAAFAV